MPPDTIAERSDSVPRLIHLNGPAGIGKSTLARLYADNHPGVLNLDIDQLVPLIGGWRDQLQDARIAARRLALGMAATHLRAGNDVVMPQLIARVSEIERFEAVAHDSDAEFCEVVLMAGKQRSLERVAHRTANHTEPRDLHLDELVDSAGGQAVDAQLYAQLYDRLVAFLAARRRVTRIDTDSLGPAQTYQALITALTTSLAG